MTGRRHCQGVLSTLILCIAAFTVACRGTALPPPAESPSPEPPLAILDAVTAHGVGSDYRPIDVTAKFSPDDTFYCIIQVSDAERDIELTARWRFGDRLITETTYVTEGQGTGYVAFELTNQQPWPEGLYRVEILSASIVLRTVEFSVVE